jgi:molybdate transport system regulatory protein
VKAITKIVFVDENGDKFFGEGPCRLMHAIEETGSLRGAAMSMGMAYTKALRLIENAEKALGFQLTTRTIGGKAGGGSRITPEGKEWLIRYENYRDACIQANQQLYLEFFSK